MIEEHQELISDFTPKFRIRSFLCILSGLFLGIFPAASAHAADWTSEKLPQYDALFQRTNGWIGADGDVTVALPDGVTLWLFSDTFVGDVRDGHRANVRMINNSAAWQRGTNPAASVKFFYRKSPDGNPASLITPADGNGHFWLGDGAMAGGKLFLFLAQIEVTDTKSAFGFRQIALWLGEISNPPAPPTQWRITQSKVPFATFGAGEYRTFGSAVLATNGFVYVYGVHERQHTGKQMILARAPESSPGGFTSWRFRTHGGWSTNAADAVDLCGNVANEYSVTWLPALRKFVLICTENGLSEKVIARTAPEPWGPWSAPDVVYRCPEMAWDRRNFCYAAKAHPMLAPEPDELIVTYAANSFEFGHVVSDARLYWPRFVRVKVQVPKP